MREKTLMTILSERIGSPVMEMAVLLAFPDPVLGLALTPGADEKNSLGVNLAGDLPRPSLVAPGVGLGIVIITMVAIPVTPALVLDHLHPHPRGEDDPRVAMRDPNTSLIVGRNLSRTLDTDIGLVLDRLGRRILK